MFLRFVTAPCTSPPLLTHLQVGGAGTLERSMLSVRFGGYVHIIGVLAQVSNQSAEKRLTLNYACLVFYPERHHSYDHHEVYQSAWDLHWPRLSVSPLA